MRHKKRKKEKFDLTGHVRNTVRRFKRRLLKNREYWEDLWEDWWMKTFGFMGPLLKSVFGIIIIALFAAALHILNNVVSCGYIAAISGFLPANMMWFFIVFMFFYYTEYFSKTSPKIYWAVSPITNGVCAAIITWVVIWIINTANSYLPNAALAAASGTLHNLLPVIFLLPIVVGYLITFMKK